MFFPRELSEPGKACFRVVVTEGATGQYGPGILLGQPTEMAVIDVDPSQPSYEVTWENHASYAVQPEHFFLVEGEAEPSSMLVELDASPFLDYVRTTTFAEDILGSLRHWELSCMDHIIHVVSADRPTVKALLPDGSYPLP